MSGEYAVVVGNAARDPDCLDACFVSRSNSDFANARNGTALTTEQITELLRLNASGIITTVVFQALIFMLWLLGDLVKGFVLYDGAGGNVSAYTHGGWWRIVEAVVILVGSVIPYFGLNYSTETGTIERSVSRTSQWIIFYYVVACIGAASNAAHFVLSVFEWSNCDSTLCTSYIWALWILAFMLPIMAALEIWCMICAYRFKHNLELALANGRLDLDLTHVGPKSAINGSVRLPALTPMLETKRTGIKLPPVTQHIPGRPKMQ